MNLGGLETNYQEILLSDNPGQKIWDNSRFPLFLHYNAVHTIKICSSIDRMFQHCLGERGGGWGGGGEQDSKRRSRVGNTLYNNESMYSKFSTFRPTFDKYPKLF